MTKKTIFVGLVLAFVCAVGTATGAFAQQEEITHFESVVRVETDGSLNVTETIAVIALGQSIRHGIYRDFPTHYTDKNGRRVVVPFDVVSVTRDGSAIPYSTKSIPNGERVYFGDTSSLLPTGAHTYAFHYKTDRQVGFFADHDEIYWNVTGNGWSFPIRAAEGIVYLPQGAKIINNTAYTGRMGETGKSYAVKQMADNAIAFRTSKPLMPSEGLTVVVSWPKGIVTQAPPTMVEQIRNTDLYQSLATYYPFYLIGFIIFYYVLAAFLERRDVPAGTIIPLFAPPPNMSPAAVNFVVKAEDETKAGFCAAIVDLAVKKYIKIHQNGGGDWVLQRLKNKDKIAYPEEASVFDALFSGGATDSKELHRNDPDMQDAYSQFEKRNTAQYAGKYFHSDVLLKVVGVGLSALGLLPLFLLSDFSPPKGDTFHVVLIFLVICNGIGIRYIKHPTTQGRQLLDKIEGFKLYLSVAEQDRLNKLNPPDLTPELFEKYLPYAIALGVENDWGEKFAAALAVAGMASTYQPGWYSGGSWHSSDINGFTSSLGHDLTSSLGSACTVPSSSSGFSGGCSGGGGGGGGGGGF